MPNDKQCEIARQITGSIATDLEINVQCGGMSSSDKFILSNSIEKILKTHDVPIEQGWKLFRQELENLALEYLVDPAVAFCLYKDWKASR